MDTHNIVSLNITDDIRKRASKIRILLMDVDGVLTDGKLYYLPASNGQQMIETKGFNSQDGLGLHFCYLAGILTGVISGRKSPATMERAKILNMRYVYEGLLDKEGAYEEILQDSGAAAEEVAFIGDDFTDIPLMRRSGLAVAVANARQEVRSIAHFVTTARGGEGAVREAIEIILHSQGLWEAVIRMY